MFNFQNYKNTKFSRLNKYIKFQKLKNTKHIKISLMEIHISKVKPCRTQKNKKIFFLILFLHFCLFCWENKHFQNHTRFYLFN